jgi:UDP-2,3-diacylglucosamine pyrophosphatase LpxH
MSRSLRTSQPPESQPNYLFFSDVHLGADLVQHARPWTVGRLRRVLQIDRELSSMLDHYREQAEPGRPWKLVIAGDLVDFVGMSLAPTTGQELETPLTAEERTHGLGSARDHAHYKMRACASRHDLVFRKLSDFVLAGHSVVLVRGNHDVDFYWETARDAFVQALVDRRNVALDESSARVELEARVEFRQWFYYVEDLLYVEHGHQYDETCSHTHWLAPMSPRDPRRIAYSFSDILMRYIVRPTPGLSTEGHDDKNIMDYLRLAFSFGIGGALRLGYRYGRAITAMFAEWRDHLGERARGVKAEHERHMHEIGERFRVSSERLCALYALSAKPVNTRPFRILSTLFVDLAATAAVSTLVLFGLLVSGLVPLTILGPIAAAVLTGLVFWHRSARVFDPPTALKRGAAHIAKLFPTRFVIMGHTHAPMMEKINNGATYVNLGGWAVDDLDHAEPASEAEADAAPHGAPCTHLVIRHIDGQPRAELRRWNSRTGIKLLHSADADAFEEDSGVRPRPEKPEERVA